MMRKAPAALVALAATVIATSAGAAELQVTALYQARLVVKLADLRTDQVVGQGGYKAGARLVTIGALGIVKPSVLLDQVEGDLRDGAPTPSVFIQVEKNGTKRRVVRFHEPGGWRSLADPLSVLLRASLQPAAGTPCLGATPVFDGRQRYDLSLTPMAGGAQAAAPTYGLVRPTACRIGFRPVSGFKETSRGPAFLRGPVSVTYGWLPSAGVWVMTDVTAPTLLGDGHIRLTGLSSSGTRPSVAPTRSAAPPPRPRKRR